MPQLNFETFVSQYFWLVFILLSFYYICATQILPKIGEALKTRRKIESGSASANAGEISETELNSEKLFANVFSTARENSNASNALIAGDLTGYQKHFLASNEAWMKQTLSNLK